MSHCRQGRLRPNWVNHIARIREWGADLLAGAKNRWRVIRTSNQYCFVDPQPPARPPHSSSFKFRTGPKAKTLSLGSVQHKGCTRPGKPTAPCPDEARKWCGEGQNCKSGARHRVIVFAAAIRPCTYKPAMSG